LSEVPPIALSAAFANDVDKQRQWAGFLRRTEFSIEPAPFQRVHDEIVRFVMPPLTAAARGEAFDLVWNDPEAGWSTPQRAN
jgi:hypothetical protein